MPRPAKLYVVIRKNGYYINCVKNSSKELQNWFYNNTPHGANEAPQRGFSISEPMRLFDALRSPAFQKS